MLSKDSRFHALCIYIDYINNTSVHIELCYISKTCFDTYNNQTKTCGAWGTIDKIFIPEKACE